MAQPICVITGVGPGTGTALARRFANGGYRVAMLARNAQRLGELSLNIYKATLHQWRADFARHLRELGVAANATPTAVRGKTKAWKRDGIYRALKRGQSTVVRRWVGSVAEELRRGRLLPEPGKDKLRVTRKTIVGGWQATAALLRATGQDALAKEVEAYVQRLPAVTTEKESIARGLLSQLATRPARARGAEGDRSAGERSR